MGENLQDHILPAGVNSECNGDLPAPHGNAADASIMPEITTGNAHAPSVLIGVMAGRLLAR